MAFNLLHIVVDQTYAFYTFFALLPTAIWDIPSILQKVCAQETWKWLINSRDRRKYDGWHSTSKKVKCIKAMF